MKRQPAYARRHRDALADPAVSIWIAIGPKAWHAVRDHVDDYDRGRPQVWLPLPDDTEPDALDWTVCRGHDPVLIWRAGPVEGTRIEALVRALFRDGIGSALTDGQHEGLRYVAEVTYG